ncbi:hypothetical protein ACWD6R_24095 [Streptomyces sp. NPDC005151]
MCNSLIATALGATVVEETTNDEPAKPEGDPWAAAANVQSGPWPGSASGTEAKAEDPSAYILGEIEKQTSVDGLKKLWAEPVLLQGRGGHGRLEGQGEVAPVKNWPEVVAGLCFAGLLALFAWVWASAPCGLWTFAKVGDVPARCITK